nr:terminase large subunit [Nocardia brasiliensis]
MLGATVWSQEYGCYKRQYEIAWIEVARKNGKSELLAGIMLYLLLMDDEESAEIYGCARNREQASLVFDVAKRMVQLSTVLRKRLRIKATEKRIVYPRTDSFYRVLAADAGGALGSNPHGVGADEILAWPNSGMWDAMRTGMGSGARRQPLMVAATTAGSDTEAFAGSMHREMQRVADDPARSPHIFVYLRNVPMDADPWNEKNWHLANPALGTFLSLEGMRKQALEARNNPIAEVAFRQFRLNQWQSATFRWMPMHLFDASVGEPYTAADAGRAAFAGADCWFGLDLASRQDLCSMAFAFPDSAGGVDVLWRFWLPEAAYARLNAANDGRFTQWVKDGWLRVTEGDVLDFDAFYADVEADNTLFQILGGDADKFASDPVLQRIQQLIYCDDIFAYSNVFQHMSPGMHHISDLVKQQAFRWHGNPLARFCFDSTDVRVDPADPDRIRPDKPNRSRAAKRIDGVPAAVMAVNAWKTRGDEVKSVYATGDYDVFTV